MDPAPSVLNLGYADASLLTPHVAGLGAVVAGRVSRRLVRTDSLQHAELQAAALAVGRAPAGQPLCLKLDCLNALEQLSVPQRLVPTFRPLVQQITLNAQRRQVTLTVRPVASEANPAHPVARAARFGAVDVAASLPKLHLRVVREGEHVRVVGPTQTWRCPQTYPDLNFVAAALRWVPRQHHVVISGLGLFTCQLWRRRERTTMGEQALVFAVQAVLVERE